MVAAATRRCLPRVLCISVLARGSLQDSEWVQGRECQPPEPADIFDPTGSATLSRSWSKPHR